MYTPTRMSVPNIKFSASPETGTTNTVCDTNAPTYCTESCLRMTLALGNCRLYQLHCWKPHNLFFWKHCGGFSFELESAACTANAMASCC